MMYLGCRLDRPRSRMIFVSFIAPERGAHQRKAMEDKCSTTIFCGLSLQRPFRNLFCDILRSRKSAGLVHSLIGIAPQDRTEPRAVWTQSSQTRCNIVIDLRPNTLYIILTRFVPIYWAISILVIYPQFEIVAY